MININFILKQLPNQPPEIYYGNKEYKIRLDYKEKSKKYIRHILEKKASQMLFRIGEGNGKAIYLIGVDDNGISKGLPLSDLLNSLYNLIRISKIINSNIKNINIYKGINGYIATIRLFKVISYGLQIPQNY